MYRQTLIHILYFLLTVSFILSCSSGRKARSSEISTGDDSITAFNYNDIFKSGVSSGSFFIKKLRILIDLEENRNSYTANLRKSDDGKWLASIQLMRVEVFRVYADKENVIMLDRVGRKAYIMSWELLAMKYGVTYDLLPAILGDIPRTFRQVQKEISCINPVRFQTEGLKYEITADCLIPRAKEIVITNATFGRSISIKAEEYGMSEERVYTSVVVVEEKSGAINFVLHIDDLTIPWNGEIDFSIPANYKIER